MQFFLDFAKVRTNLFLIFSLILVCCGFVSCKKEKEPDKLIIGDDFYYWEADADSNLGDAMRNMQNFKKLEDTSTRNLRNVLGAGPHFVWVKAEFEIPEGFKDVPLGLVIPHLKFAEQLFLNGNFISMYGDFPPHEQSTLFKAHFFSFPINLLNRDGKNIILIKVFAQGKAGISSHSFILPTQFAYPAFERINFNHTRIYMFFVGSQLFAFLLFLCFFINIRSYREFRDFALLNIFTLIFLIPFFATELPMYTNGFLPYMPFIKFTLCIPPCFMIYFATLFAIDYHNRYYKKIYKIIRLTALAVQVIMIILAPTYESLVKITPIILVLIAFQLIIGIRVVIQELLKKETRVTALQFIFGFMPVIITAIFDISIRHADKSKVYPYFSIFGWQLSIIAFIVLLAIRFASIYRRNKELSEHLTEEITAATLDLQNANDELSVLNLQLEKDKHRSDMDLEMAALVQRNFFPQPNKHFRGWEISICYSPAAKVSGDFYDYYTYNDILNGISLFDVSGHGLSASLITMLSKNIISRIFQIGFHRKEPIDKVLTKINNKIIYEKGGIANYMTGILCRFDDSETPGKCSVELGNAGHPYPLKFSLRDNEIFELRGNDGKPHYGAIGMEGINVSFARSNFSMATGDILILYTDGITESTNSHQIQFGVDRLKEVIRENHAKPANEIIGHIINKLEEFVEYRPFEDDITLIIAKRTNAAEYVAEEEHDDVLDDEIEELTDA